MKRGTTRANSRFNFVSESNVLSKSKRSNSRFNFVSESNVLSKSKRSQTTIFIIIAIIIVIVIGAYFVVKQGDIKENKVPIEVFPVYEFVSDCIAQTGEEAIYHVGQTGGYVMAPNESEEGIAYYLYENENKMPEKTVLEDEISDYMNSLVYFCFNNFVSLSDFEISGEEVMTTTKIEDDRVIFNVNYPMSVQKGEDSYSLENFETEVEIRLGQIYLVLQEIMQKQMNEPDAVCISCLDDISKVHDVKIKMFEGNDSSIVFAVVDEKSKAYDNDYEFYFVNKYEVEG